MTCVRGKLLDDIYIYIRTLSHLYLTLFFAKATARFATLSFNRPVTGGFNLHSRDAGSLDSISLRVDTLLDVLHERARIQLRGVCTPACSLHKLDVTIRIQAARWYVFQCIYSRALSPLKCMRRQVYVHTRKCGELSYIDACAYSQNLSLILCRGE